MKNDINLQELRDATLAHDIDKFRPRSMEKPPITDHPQRFEVAQTVLQGMVAGGHIDYHDPDVAMVRCWRLADAFLRCDAAIDSGEV